MPNEIIQNKIPSNALFSWLSILFVRHSYIEGAQRSSKPSVIKIPRHRLNENQVPKSHRYFMGNILWFV